MPLSTRNQPIRPDREEAPTEDLKTTYHRTRADSEALIAAIQPGMSLYIHHDGQNHEWIVTEGTGALRNSPILAPAGNDAARVTLHQLLARCGAIHTQPPTERTTT